jgi:hypothetical protein
VGLVDAVKEVFTRAKIWELLGDEMHTAGNLEDCMFLIRGNGGNQREAMVRAGIEGRDIEEELIRWNQLS